MHLDRSHPSKEPAAETRERPAKHILGQEREALVGHLKERALTNPRGPERMSFFKFSLVTRLAVGSVWACGEVCMVVFNMVHKVFLYS